MNNQLKTILMLGALTVLLISMGGYLGEAYLIGFSVLAVLLNFVSYFFSDKIVLRMSGAQEVSAQEAPRLHAMIADLASRAEIPMPRVFITPERQPNAFATGRDPKHGVVAVTRGILDTLGERELRGVLAHEIAHIKNRDILIASVAATVAMAISLIANIVKWGAILGGQSRDRDGGSAMGALAMAIIAPIAAVMIQMGISRSREYIADETGAKLSGDPEGLARALEGLHRASTAIPAHVEPATASMYIVNPFTGMRGMLNLFSTHPPMEERITRLRAMMYSMTA